MKRNHMGIITEIENIIQKYALKERFSGAVLLQKSNEILFKKAYGYANRTWEIPNQVDTRFRIASISKMFTSVAILQLVEKEHLSLSTRILEVLPIADSTIPQEATVYHMLTMTSGIPDWFDESGDWEAEWQQLCREHPIYLFRRNKDYLPLFIHEPPLFELGQKHQYNGAGYILLGLVIEAMSGLSYFDYVREHIFKPLQMYDSDFIDLDSVAPHTAEGYMPQKPIIPGRTKWLRNIYSTTPSPAADGGATSTLLDLQKFSIGLRDERLLSPVHTAEILSPKVPMFDKEVRGYLWAYGYANIFLSNDSNQIVRWGHTGEEDGFSCRLYFYPTLDMDVIILGNQSWCAADLAWKIHDMLLGNKGRAS